LAFSDASGDKVSGRFTHAKMNPDTSIPKASTDTPKWLKYTANIGDSAKPNENPADTKPKDGARHIGGMTSDNADSAIANQLTKPDIA
jgi:hypothetical protein